MILFDIALSMIDISYVKSFSSTRICPIRKSLHRIIARATLHSSCVLVSIPNSKSATLVDALPLQCCDRTASTIAFSVSFMCSVCVAVLGSGVSVRVLESNNILTV